MGGLAHHARAPPLALGGRGCRLGSRHLLDQLRGVERMGQHLGGGREVSPNTRDHWPSAEGHREDEEGRDEDDRRVACSVVCGWKRTKRRKRVRKNTRGQHSNPTPPKRRRKCVYKTNLSTCPSPSVRARKNENDRRAKTKVPFSFFLVLMKDAKSEKANTSCTYSRVHGVRRSLAFDKLNDKWICQRGDQRIRYLGP